MNSSNLKVSTWLTETFDYLKKNDVGTPRLDALVLLEDVTGKERSWLIAHPEAMLTGKEVEKLEGFVKRRATHEPLAYIRNKTEFYGRDFYIDNHVLEPRPESETMIDLLKETAAEDKPNIIDIGTGSGNLAITAKLEMPWLKIIASDLDKNCLVIARKNAQMHGVKVRFLYGDLLLPLEAHSLLVENSILLCNLPYIPTSFRLNQAALNEPQTAIFGGITGLDLYRRLFQQCIALDFFPKFILTESLPTQHQKLSGIALTANFHLVKTDDFIQVFTH